jgi:EAL domain-containing protein (putative c-di-GMP-specific phosphodiesterase class I)
LTPSPGDDLTSARVLIVDDEPANLRLLTDMLASAGYREVMACPDSADVVDRFLTFRPDVLLLDWHMPSPDGAELISALAELIGEDDYLPVIALTADTTPETRYAALLHGANDFLAKPFDYSELLLRIRNMTRTRRLNEQMRDRNRRLRLQLEEHNRVVAAQAEREAEITARVGQVVAGNGLSMVFQPIVDLLDGSIIGAEALSRFTGGPRQPPDIWFQDAHLVGLGRDLEVAAIVSAVRQLPDLPPGAFLSLNASAATIVSEALAMCLDDHPAHRLVLELTEHDHIQDYTTMLEPLAALRSRGVRLAVDDAGAGFASLQHILKLQPEIIKLDRILISSIDQDPVRRALVAALVHFADEADALLVAEGIETPAELEVLRTLGIRLGQGYLMAMPAPLPITVHLPQSECSIAQRSA